MGENLTRKIIREHLTSGQMIPGEEIGLRIDQTLTQDATGTMACLEFEAMGVPRVRTQLSVNYVDHNTLQTSFENADDHRFLRTFSARYGMRYSRPGNGICHQVHYERFARPGATLLGADSHTPHSGSVGSLAIGAGGLDVALAMAGQPYFLPMPKVVRVELLGRLRPWVSAKDVILELLRRLSVQGGVGKVFEFTGEGLADLDVPERAVISNMTAELGATSGIFPSDDQTRAWLRLQQREHEWQALGPDPDATYDESLALDMSQLEPLVARPHSPDNVVPVSDIEGLPVDQVCIGACTNSTYGDLAIAAAVVRGKLVHPRLCLVVTPGSRQIHTLISESGVLADLENAGARVLEAVCGPCIGMGQAPPTNAVSVRTFNRNFQGRSGTPSANVYIASPAIAAAAAIAGEIVDPRRLGEAPKVSFPTAYPINDDRVFPELPEAQATMVEVIRGPNIKPLPKRPALPDEVTGRTLLVVGDDVTTDHIMPAGARVLIYRSNIPAISAFTFERIDPTFPTRAQQWGGGIVIAGRNYGQGSSREHAALAPMYLGVQAIIAKSFARIHRANLINFGILPLVFVDPTDYDGIQQGDNLRIVDTGDIEQKNELTVQNRSRGTSFRVRHDLSPRQARVMRAGGLLNYVRDGGTPVPSAVQAAGGCHPVPAEFEERKASS